MAACTGKTTTGGATARKVAATDTTDASCTSCISGTTFGAADGSEDCAAVTVLSTLSACTKKVGPGDTGVARKVAGTAIADATCTSCIAGTTFGKADGSEDCASVTAYSACIKKVGPGNAGALRKVAGTATADASCTSCIAHFTFGKADGSEDCLAVTVCGTQIGGATRLTGATAIAGPGTCAACTDGSSASSDTANCAAVTCATTGGSSTCPTNSAVRALLFLTTSIHTIVCVF